MQILASQTSLRSTTRIIATPQDGDIPMFISWKEFKHNGFTTALTRWQAGQKDQRKNRPVYLHYERMYQTLLKMKRFCNSENILECIAKEYTVDTKLL